ncbi:MAG TPA: 3-hydroxyacyl-CoA dehydrogenase NAD-binding domain-containing protein [Pirellula sp.]|nr:3-hydroxyacyl-CoA dehydrogenase NAD-binding domain-containing protein [Pirellula sp.]
MAPIKPATPNAFIDNTNVGETFPPIQRVLIIGAGWTGRQIAGQMAAYGLDLMLVDSNSQALDVSRAWILDQRESFFEQGYWPNVCHEQLANRIQCANGIDAVVGEFDLVLESVSEQFSLKRRILKACSERFQPPSIIASNSSYFTPSMLQPHVVSPERFANFHFHVPIWRATLVDIASGPMTKDSTLQRLVDLASRIGQTPLVQRIENPGYVVNWMLKALLQSALQLIDRKVAQPADIDMAWKKVTGMPIGPFGIMDQIGVDLIHQTMSHARFVDGDEVWQPLVDILQTYVDSNRLGVKTGQGFFDY